jgi:hypothetical protein
MKTQITLLTLLSFFCFSLKNLEASPLTHKEAGECRYLEPIQPVNGEDFFHELIERGNNEKETFTTIATYLAENAISCHRFQFQYPLKNKAEAQIFAKVLQIKAQEAHRFVPVIAFSQFIAPRHLGFIRKIKIDRDGPLIQEHVLVDRTFDHVIFIEEFIEDASGEVELGCFSFLPSSQGELWRPRSLVLPCPHVNKYFECFQTP